MKDVDIKISSVIENLDECGLTEDTERDGVTARGVFEYRATGCVLEYDEERDGSKVHSALTVTGGKVTLKKTGDINCAFTFISGEETSAIYSTGAFSFDVKITTKRFNYDATPDACAIRLIYSMNIGGQEKKVNLALRATPAAKA